MRILIPNFPAPDSFVDNVTITLRNMGHEVHNASHVTTYSNQAMRNIVRDLRDRIFPNRFTEGEIHALTIAKSWRPDLILCLTQALREEVLFELRQVGVRFLVAWWGDTPANMRGMGLLASGWDVVFLKDKSATAKFKAVGIEAALLHEAMNPSWHKRCFEQVGNEVIVAGSYYGYRQYLVDKLISAGEPMALFGPSPPRWARATIRNAHRGKYIVKEEKSRIFGSGLACLNSTALSEGDSLNCRAFEIAGACGLQLIEDKPAVAQCFEPGREVLIYRSVSEIREHLSRARSEPSWAMAIREAGHKRALAEHTYAHRLYEIFRHLGESP